MNEVRSYRRVFDLERRIYTIDRLRLNPNGVPVRGVVYAAAAAFTFVALSRLPVIGRPLSATPWLIRDLVLPGALGALLSMIRVEGRSSHAALVAALSFVREPRRLAALRPTDAPGGRWRPTLLITLPGTAEDRVRRLRYRGPGIVVLAAPHEPHNPPKSPGARRVTTPLGRDPARRIAVGAAPSEDAIGASPRAISVRRRKTVVFVPAPERSR